jgi:hypothetical protein
MSNIKYFDKIYPIHLKALGDPDYKYLMFAQQYVKKWNNAEKYLDKVKRLRINTLKKYGVRTRWKITQSEWDILLINLQ